MSDAETQRANVGVTGKRGLAGQILSVCRKILTLMNGRLRSERGSSEPRVYEYYYQALKRHRSSGFRCSGLIIRIQ